ncbi:hypothetical protein FB645_004491 [Coemansia sp. IMI 203386]|nr:hypothetical protein FB645_004491 [Coemansia sp. IMI 203386]
MTYFGAASSSLLGKTHRDIPPDGHSTEITAPALEDLLNSIIRISSDDLSQEMLVFFSDHLLLSEIDRLRYIIQFQISNQNAAISHLREKISRQTKLLREARNYIEQLQSGHVEPIGGNRASLKFGHPNVSPAAASAAPVWDFAADRPTQNRQPSSAMTAMKTTTVPLAPQRIARVRPPEFSNLANHMVSQSPRPLLYPRHIGTDSNTHHATTFPSSNRHRSASRIRASSYMSSAASSALPTPRSSYGSGFSKTNPFYSNNPQQPFGPR